MHWRTQQKPNSSSIHDFNHSNFCLQEINLMNIKFAPTFTPTMLATHASFFCAPAHLLIAANLFGLEPDYAAVCLLGLL